jgi:DNA replication initiation complex subunit (GINS family)
LSKKLKRLNLKIGAHVKDTTQEKSNLRAIAAKVKDTRLVRGALIKGRAHIAPQDHAVWLEKNVLVFIVKTPAKITALRITTSAVFLSSWGRKVNTGV